MPGQHAFLTASGAKEWLNCTPSAHLCARYPEQTSEAADEGTCAHALSEKLIELSLHNTGPYNDPCEYTAKQTRIKNEIAEIQKNPHYQKDPVNMQRHCEDFRDYVLLRYNELKQQDESTYIILETRLNLSRYIPEGFGTTDVMIIGNRKIIVIDLKYGKGVKVEAEQNDQEKIYTLGALDFFSDIYDIDDAEMVIYQPRMDNISDWTTSVPELREWAETVLIPRAKMAFAGEGEYVAGPHCKFCKARHECRAKADYEMGIVALMKEPVLTANEKADIISRAKEIKEWLGRMEEMALAGMLAGTEVLPGFKLVAGRSVSTYADEKAIAQKMLENGLKPEQIYKPLELKGITEMEKLTGKIAFANYTEGQIVIPPGRPTLVLASDKREEYKEAELERLFGEIETED